MHKIYKRSERDLCYVIRSIYLTNEYAAQLHTNHDHDKSFIFGSDFPATLKVSYITNACFHPFSSIKFCPIGALAFNAK